LSDIAAASTAWWSARLQEAWEAEVREGTTASDKALADELALASKIHEMPMAESERQRAQFGLTRSLADFLGHE
jgi:hypothetical protein